MPHKLWSFGQIGGHSDSQFSAHDVLWCLMWYQHCLWMGQMSPLCAIECFGIQSVSLCVVCGDLFCRWNDKSISKHNSLPCLWNSISIDFWEFHRKAILKYVFCFVCVCVWVSHLSTNKLPRRKVLKMLWTNWDKTLVYRFMLSDSNGFKWNYKIGIGCFFLLLPEKDTIDCCRLWVKTNNVNSCNVSITLWKWGHWGHWRTICELSVFTWSHIIDGSAILCQVIDYILFAKSQQTNLSKWLSQFVCWMV